MNKFFAFITVISLLACNSTKNTTANKNASVGTNETSPLQQKQSEGIDLFAKGKVSSSWTLEVDFDKAIRFKSLDGTNIIASSTRPVEVADEKRTTITTTTEFGKMQIDIYTQECVDEISGEKFEKKITIQVNNKNYTGCGSFLYDPNIIGKWTLQQWNGKKLNAGDFAKGLPQIQFDKTNGRITGHDGCNQYFGEMELRGNYIMIKAIGSTKMACPGNNAEKQLAGKFSNQVISYYFKDNMLHLYLPDDTLAVLSKA